MGYRFKNFLDDVSPIGGGIKDIISLPYQTATSIFSTLGGTLTNVTSSLSMPLMLLGGGVLLVMMNKK